MVMGDLGPIGRDAEEFGDQDEGEERHRECGTIAAHSVRRLMTGFGNYVHDLGAVIAQSQKRGAYGLGRISSACWPKSLSGCTGHQFRGGRRGNVAAQSEGHFQVRHS
jgi:hypothetical protein